MSGRDEIITVHLKDWSPLSKYNQRARYTLPWPLVSRISKKHQRFRLSVLFIISGRNAVLATISIYQSTCQTNKALILIIIIQTLIWSTILDWTISPAQCMAGLGWPGVRKQKEMKTLLIRRLGPSLGMGANNVQPRGIAQEKGTKSPGFIHMRLEKKAVMSPWSPSLVIAQHFLGFISLWYKPARSNSEVAICCWS